MKCDEGKPYCLRCRDTGRACDGYAHVASTKRKESSLPDDITSGDITANTSNHATGLQKDILLPAYFIRELFSSLPGNKEERRSLHYYHTTAVHYISGYFESAFWYRRVLQISHSAPPVRHALLAISSMYESMETQRRHTDPTIVTCPSRYSLEQYNKAIHHLVRDIQTKSTESRRTAMIACLLFAWLEELFGNHLKANTHVIWGLKILQRPMACPIREGPPVSTYLSWPPSCSLMLPAIMSFVKRVETGLPLEGRQTTGGQEGKKEGPFYSIKQARASLEANVSALTFLIRRAQNEVGDESLQTWARARLYEGLGSWQSHYLTFLENCKHSLSSRERRATIVLQISYITTTIILRSCFTRSEMEYDKLQADFTRLVALIQSIMDPAQTARLGYRRLPDYSFEGAVIFPLYYTVLKCRNSATRHEALNLLRRGPMKEGIWERDLALKIAAQVVELEETGTKLDKVGHHAPVSEERRISRMDVTVRYESQEYLMEVWRGSPDDNKDNRTCEQYRGTW